MGWRCGLESVFGGTFTVINKMENVRRCNSMESGEILLDEDNYYIPVSDGGGDTSAMGDEEEEENVDGTQDLLDATGRGIDRSDDPVDEVTGPARGRYRGRRGMGGYHDLGAYERGLHEDKVEEMRKNTSRPICIYPNVDKVTCEDGTILLRTVRANGSITIPARSGITVETNVVFCGINEYSWSSGRVVNEVIDLDHHWLSSETLRLIQIKKGNVCIQDSGRFKVWVYNLSETAVVIATSSPLATLKTFRSQYPI